MLGLQTSDSVSTFIKMGIREGMIVVAHRVICDGFFQVTARETPLFSLLGYLWSLSSRKARCDVVVHRGHPSFFWRETKVTMVKQASKQQWNNN